MIGVAVSQLCEGEADGYYIIVYITAMTQDCVVKQYIMRARMSILINNKLFKH